MSLPSRLVLVCAFLLPTAALADAIDGTWCAPVGSRLMHIAGPVFTTPGGHQVIGAYHRHDGSYVIPEGEPGAGGTVFLLLLGDEAMRVTEPDAPPLVWQRCAPPGLNS